MTPAARRYAFEFGGAMTAYSLVTMFVMPRLFHTFKDTAPWVALAAVLIPVVPAVFALIAIVRFAQSWDELQRRKAFEAMLIGFLVSGFGFFIYGFLEAGGFAPPLLTLWVFPIMIASYGLGTLIVRLRYR